MNILQKLTKAKLISPPYWLVDNTFYLTMHGSHAYQVNKNNSDVDIYGIVIPPKAELFFTGEIVGYGKLKNLESRFRHFQKHQVLDTSDNLNRNYDFNITNIVDFFELASECNPNWLEVLFTDVNCILHTTAIGKLLRDNRNIFLSKKVYHTMTNYAYSQLNKAKSTEKVGKRKVDIDRLGYDPKSLYHCARLIDQCEQILSTGTLELGRNKEYLKSIRREEISFEEVQSKFKEKESYLTKLYETSDVVPLLPQKAKIKDLLFQCIEMHYGDLTQIVPKEDAYRRAFEEISSVVSKHRNLL